MKVRVDTVKCKAAGNEASVNGVTDYLEDSIAIFLEVKDASEADDYDPTVYTNTDRMAREITEEIIDKLPLDSYTFNSVKVSTDGRIMIDVDIMEHV